MLEPGGEWYVWMGLWGVVMVVLLAWLGRSGGLVRRQVRKALQEPPDGLD